MTDVHCVRGINKYSVLLNYSEKSLKLLFCAMSIEEVGGSIGVK